MEEKPRFNHTDQAIGVSFPELSKVSERTFIYGRFATGASLKDAVRNLIYGNPWQGQNPLIGNTPGRFFDCSSAQSKAVAEVEKRNGNFTFLSVGGDKGVNTY